MVLDTGTVKATSVWSATKAYLAIGIAGILLLVGMFGAVTYNFFISPLNEAIGAAIIVCLFAWVFPALLTMYLPAYKRRQKFVMYRSDLNENVKWIKEKYHICLIDEHGVIFVNKNDRRAYDDWMMYQKFVTTQTDGHSLFWKEGAEAV